jgi:hypothetical protein
MALTIGIGKTMSGIRKFGVANIIERDGITYGRIRSARDGCGLRMSGHGKERWKFSGGEKTARGDARPPVGNVLFDGEIVPASH